MRPDSKEIVGRTLQTPPSAPACTRITAASRTGPEARLEPQCAPETTAAGRNNESRSKSSRGDTGGHLLALLQRAAAIRVSFSRLLSAQRHARCHAHSG